MAFVPVFSALYIFFGITIEIVLNSKCETFKNAKVLKLNLILKCMLVWCVGWILKNFLEAGFWTVFLSKRNWFSASNSSRKWTDCKKVTKINFIQMGLWHLLLVAHLPFTCTITMIKNKYNILTLTTLNRSIIPKYVLMDIFSLTYINPNQACFVCGYSMKLLEKVEKAEQSKKSFCLYSFNPFFSVTTCNDNLSQKPNFHFF